MTLRTRSLTPEILDREDVDDATLAAVLRDLAAVNTLTRARAPTVQFMRRVARGGGRLRVLDVGFGDGDMLRRIARWGRRAGVDLSLSGVDLASGAACAARAKTPPWMGIDYRTGDLFDEPPGTHDVIISSLFTHHLTDPQIVRFLQWMERSARRGWFINDLHRHILARDGFALLSAAARFHPIVQADGRLSVERSFRRADWQRLLHQAGVPGRITWHMPFRYCVASCRP